MRILFYLSLLLTLLSAAWEVRTRIYLSDVALEVTANGVTGDRQKVQAILDWMKAESHQLQAPPWEHMLRREPIINLAHGDTLRDCGTAVNAFINLNRALDIPARRLLLLNDKFETYHVEAEVLIGSEWTVVDAAHYQFLNQFRENLGLTDHVRVARIPVVGPSIQSWLIRKHSHWSDSIYLTDLLERESTLALVASLILFFFTVLLELLGRTQTEETHARGKRRLYHSLFPAAFVSRHP